MSDGLRELLHEAAATPTRPVDPGRIHRLRRARQRRGWATGMGAVVLLLVVVVAAWRPPGGGPPVIEDPPTPTTTTTPDPSPDPSTTDGDQETGAATAIVMDAHEWPDGPSQSAGDAARDGVLADIAALPASERIGALDAAVTPEGIWVTSRMPCDEDCADRQFGDADGAYPRDRVGGQEYGELLLLDPTALTIRRAWPLPGMPPNGYNANDRLQVTDDAVYFAHQGDGALPDTYLMRVDRETLEPVVRMVQYQPGTWDDPSTSEREDGPPFSYWSRAPESSDVNIQNGLVAADDVVATIGHSGTVVLYDPVTLEATSRSDPSRSVRPGPRGTLLAMAGDPPAEFLDPRDLSAARVDLPPLDLSGAVVDTLDTPDRVALIVGASDGYRVAAWTPAGGGWTVAALPGPGLGDRTARPKLSAGADTVLVLHDDVIYRLVGGPTPTMEPWATPDRILRDNLMTPPGGLIDAPDGNGPLLLGDGRYWTLPQTDDGAPDGPPAGEGLSAAQLNAELRQLLDAAGFAPRGGDHDIGYATESIQLTVNRTQVSIWIGYGPTEVAAPLTADFVTRETHDGGGASVRIGTWPDDIAGAVVDCLDRTLTLRVAPSLDVAATTSDGFTAVSEVADELAAAWDCTGQDGTDPSVLAADLEDGRHAVYLHGIDTPDRRLTVDVIQWLSGDQATRAYQADNPGETGGPPNDYYIVNDDPGTRTLPVDGDASVELVWLHDDGDPDLDPGTWDELEDYLRGYAADEGRLSYNPFWVTIQDHTVVSIEEQYIP